MQTRAISPGRPYSAGERLTNLLVFLAAMPTAERARFVTPRLCEFLRESVAWIFRHVEYYGRTETNNHVLNNARALVVGGSVTGAKSHFLRGCRHSGAGCPSSSRRADFSVSDRRTINW